MAEHRTALCPLRPDHSASLLAEVFSHGDPDPSGFVFPGGRPATRDQVDALVRDLLAGADEGAIRPFVFVDSEGQIVGQGTITAGEPGEAAEVSLLIAPGHRQRGHAERGLLLLADEAFAGGAGTVEAVVHVANGPVLTILPRVGFTQVSPANPVTETEIWAKASPL